MNTVEIASSPNSLERRMVSIERGLRLFCVIFLLLSSAPNLAAAFSIRSYTAAFPGVLNLPLLPAVVQLVLGHPSFFIGLAFLWPLAGSIITLRAHDPFRAVIASCIYLVLVTVQ